MCFSPDVDVAAGVVVGSIGISSLRHVRRPRDLPLASLPLLFGAHQLTEAFLWWGLMGKVTPASGRIALWGYMTFAFVVLPVLAPVAVFLVEPDSGRRRLISRFALLGALVSVVYLGAMVHGPIGATVTNRMLSYRTTVPHGPFVALAYMVATVGALLSSSHRRIARFGEASVVALPLLLLAAAYALTSLWCSWAAVTSVVIARHQRSGDGAAAHLPRSPGGAGRGNNRRVVARVALARIASWTQWSRYPIRPAGARPPRRNHR